MKNQRFRYKLIALLLMGLLLLAGVYGIRTIPLTGPSDSLRDSILRLTGQSASPPAESPSPSPDGVSAESQKSAAGESQADGSGGSSPGESPADSSESVIDPASRASAYA